MTSNEERLTPEEAAADVIKDNEERLQILNGLAKKIEDELSDRALKRVNKDGEWQTCLQLYHSPLNDGDSYYSDRPFDVKKTARKRPTPNIVRTKCDTAVSNSVSMQFAAGEKNWDLWPPANNQDPAVAQACRLMEKEIQTQLDQCRYPMHARRAIEDRVILGTGVMKGPVNTGKMRTKYVKEGTSWVPQMVRDSTPAVEYVPVWRFYPDMSVAEHAQSLSDIELHPMSALELSQLRQNPGFDRQAIEAILNTETGVKPQLYNDTYLSKITSRVWESSYMYKDRYSVIEYHGPVTYDEADKLGLTPTYTSPTNEYYGEIWVCAGRVIRMELENIEGAFETPYSVAVWKRDPTSPFGFGHPLLLADSQRVVTQTYHMILDNASLTSGPQISMYQQFIQPADGQWQIAPNKVWLLTDPTVDINKAINFFTPTNTIGNIMPVLALARGFAEEESATTAFAAGLGSPQNVESATGQLMMAQNSTTLLDFLAEEWDDQVTEKQIRRMYGWNMQYNPKEEIKGDYMIDVKSSTEYKNKQTHIRDLERLSVEGTQNPTMGMWLNMDELQKARLSLMSLPGNKIVRTQEEYAAAVQQMQQQPNPQQVELQMKQMELQMKKEELDIKKQQLQFEMVQAQQREQWEHEEKMGSNYARAQEAQAQVIKARAEVDVEMYKLAAKDKQILAKLQNDRVMRENDTQAKVFMKGMEQNQKAIDQQLTAEELDIKRTKGTGI